MSLSKISFKALFLLMLAIVMLAPPSIAFTSGSDGSDGVLLVDAQGVVDFFQIPIDHSDGIYNFTEIVIESGVELQIKSATHGPVTWLASSFVTIDGEINLSGGEGHGVLAQFRSIPGAGGFAGGTGGNDLLAAKAGSGPGAGYKAFSTDKDNNGSGAGHLLQGDGPGSGNPYGNEFLLPLIGGSGGGGGFDQGSQFETGSGGGAGGGALLIASSSSIVLGAGGGILADGGEPGTAGGVTLAGGGGSGGSLRLVAPLIFWDGGLFARGTATDLNQGSAGRIRVEAYDIQSGANGSSIPPASTGLPGALRIPAEQLPLRITRVDGIDVPAHPTGGFNPPDVMLATGEPVTVEIEARGVPLGTEAGVSLFTDTGELFSFNSTPLTGTVEQSTATVEITFPTGFAGLFVTANWTP